MKHIAWNDEKNLLKKMNEIKLDAEEKELLASYEADEWQPVDNIDEQLEKYSSYANAT